MSTAIITRDTVKTLIEGSKVDFTAAIEATGVSINALKSSFMNAIIQNPKLQNCTKVSLMQAMYHCALLGLMPNKTLGHVWLIPYGDVMQVQPGYQGIIELARRHNPDLAPIKVFTNYSGDNLIYEDGFDVKFQLKPTPTPGEILAYFAITKLRETKLIHRLTVEQVREIERKSRKGSQKTPAWRDWEPQMALTKVAKGVVKYVPKNDSMAKALQLDTKMEIGHTVEIDIPDEAIKDEVLREETKREKAKIEESNKRHDQANQKSAQSQNSGNAAASKLKPEGTISIQLKNIGEITTFIDSMADDGRTPDEIKELKKLLKGISWLDLDAAQQKGQANLNTKFEFKNKKEFFATASKILLFTTVTSLNN